MKTFDLRVLEQFAARRPPGYIEDVLSHGTVAGGAVTLTEEAYDKLAAKYRKSHCKPPARAPGPALPAGPGTELKQLLAGWPFYIKTTATCSCNKRARIMDENEAREPGWCAANLDTIVGWLREEAEKRKLPFLDMAGRMLVQRAIRNFKKAKDV